MLYSLQKEHLEKSKFSAESQQLFSEDKFRKEENTIKFCRLFQRFFFKWSIWWEIENSKAIFVCTGLSCIWKANVSQWFITEKVDSFPHGFLSCSMHKKLEKYTFFFQIKGAWCACGLNFSRTYFAVFRKLSPTLSARITEGLNKRMSLENSAKWNKQGGGVIC